MRTFLPLVIVAAMLAVPASAGTRNFGVSGFDRIRVDGPFRVRVTTGVPPSAQANGPNDAIDKVAIDVQGSTLVVHVNQSGWSNYPGGGSSGPVTIDVGTHELNSATLNGAGSLDISAVKGLKFDMAVVGSGVGNIADVDVDQLGITVVGTASASLKGRTGKLTAIIRGISSLNAAALDAKDATIGAEGGGTVTAQVTGDASIDATGTASVTVSGAPSCTVHANGSATVSGCKQP